MVIRYTMDSEIHDICKYDEWHLHILYYIWDILVNYLSYILFMFSLNFCYFVWLCCYIFSARMSTLIFVIILYLICICVKMM